MYFTFLLILLKHIVKTFLKNQDIYIIELNQYVKRWAPGATSSINVVGNLTQMDPDNHITPSGIFVDNAGNIYVADESNKARVVKWPPYVNRL